MLEEVQTGMDACNKGTGLVTRTWMSGRYKKHYLCGRTGKSEDLPVRRARRNTFRKHRKLELFTKGYKDIPKLINI